MYKFYSALEIKHVISVKLHNIIDLNSDRLCYFVARARDSNTFRPELVIYLTTILFFLGRPAYSQDLDGAAIRLGETNFIPSIRLDFENTDNTFRTNGELIESNQTIVRPGFYWEATRRLLTLSATYLGGYTVVSETAPTFADHLLTLTGDAELTSRNRSSVRLSFQRDHDDIGEGVLSGITSNENLTVSTRTDLDLEAEHIYGAASAKGNLSAGLRLNTVDFDNPQAQVFGFGFTSISPYLEFRYRLSRSARLIAGAAIADFNYDNDFRDRLSTSFFTGAVFNGADQLTGSIRFGATQSDFTAENRTDKTFVFVNGDLKYRPTGISTFNLSIRRKIDDVRGNLSNVDSPIQTSLDFDWRYTWSSRISTEAGVLWELFDANCPNASYTIAEPSIELAYTFRRWVAFGLRSSREQRTVSNCDDTTVNTEALTNYERNQFSVFVKATL